MLRKYLVPVLPEDEVDDDHDYNDGHAENTNTNSNLSLLEITILLMKDWLSLKITFINI